jgi:hypothetical protein
MLLKFFKRPLPIVFATIIVLAILLWLKSFLTGLSVIFYFDEVQMPLYALIANIISNNGYLAKILAFTIVLLTGLYLIQLNSKHILIKQRSYLPAFLYILLASSFLPMQRLNPAIFAAIFLAIAINFLFSIYDEKEPLDKLFKASMFISLAMMFYLPSIFYIVLVFISIIIIKTFNFRDWIAVLAGFITPWFFYFFYQYLINDNLWAIPQIIEAVWNTERVKTDYGLFFNIFYYFNGLLFLISAAFLLRSINTQKINIRKYHTILLWFLVITFFVNVFVPFCSIELSYIAAIPVSFIVSNFLTSSRKKFWPEFLLIALFAIAIIMQFL